MLLDRFSSAVFSLHLLLSLPILPPVPVRLFAVAFFLFLLMLAPRILIDCILPSIHFLQFDTLLAIAAKSRLVIGAGNANEHTAILIATETIEFAIG